MVREAGIAVVKERKTAVASLGLGPREVPTIEIRAIVLKPGQHGGIARGVRPNALNLSHTQRIIQGREGRHTTADPAAYAELEDTAIVTYVDGVLVRIQCKRVLVSVYAAVLRKKCPVGSRIRRCVDPNASEKDAGWINGRHQ